GSDGLLQSSQHHIAGDILIQVGESNDHLVTSLAQALVLQIAVIVVVVQALAHSDGVLHVVVTVGDQDHGLVVVDQIPAVDRSDIILNVASVINSHGELVDGSGLGIDVQLAVA